MPEQLTKLTEEGNFHCKIIAVQPIEHRFKTEERNMFEVKITCQTEDNRIADIYLDLSNDYGFGNQSHLTRKEISIEQLNALGMPGAEFSKLSNIVGKSIEIYGKVNDKGRLNFYISSQREEKAVDAARLEALFGSDPGKPSGKKSDGGGQSADTGADTAAGSSDDFNDDENPF